MERFTSAERDNWLRGSLVTPMMGTMPFIFSSSLAISTDSPERETIRTTASFQELA